MQSLEAARLLSCNKAYHAIGIEDRQGVILFRTSPLISLQLSSLRPFLHQSVASLIDDGLRHCQQKWTEAQKSN